MNILGRSILSEEIDSPEQQQKTLSENDNNSGKVIIVESIIVEEENRPEGTEEHDTGTDTVPKVQRAPNPKNAGYQVPNVGLPAPGTENGNQTDCTQPAITRFPRPLLNKNARLYGGVIIYIFVAMYMFVGLAIVCEDYFVSALDRISEGRFSKHELYDLVFTYQ